MNKCSQFQCSHNPDNDTIKKGVNKDLMCALCPICASCGANQWEINDNCDNCLLCESREGYIRRGQPKPMIEVAIKQKNDVEIVKQLIMDKKEIQNGISR
jgi:hypothetical protein